MSMFQARPFARVPRGHIAALLSFLACPALGQPPMAPAATSTSVATWSLRLAGEVSTRARFDEGGRLGQRSIAIEPAWTRRTPDQLWTLQARVEKDRYEARSRGDPIFLGQMDGRYETLAVSLQWIQTGPVEWMLRGDTSFSKHEEASIADALAFGLIAAGRLRATDQFVGGLALRLQHDFLNEWSIIPLPTFEYRWRPEWSLALDRALALRYQPAPPARDRLAVEVEPFVRQYRLAPKNDLSDGMFSVRRAAVQLRWDRRWRRQFSTELRVGVSAWQELVIKDADRRTLWRGDSDPAWVAGMVFRYALP